jgi:hypothetical protein
VVHSCNSNIWEAEAGWLQVWDQPGLHSETLSKVHKEKRFRLRKSLRDKAEIRGISTRVYCKAVTTAQGSLALIWRGRNRNLIFNNFFSKHWDYHQYHSRQKYKWWLHFTSYTGKNKGTGMVENRIQNLICTMTNPSVVLWKKRRLAPFGIPGAIFI